MSNADKGIGGKLVFKGDSYDVVSWERRKNTNGMTFTNAQAGPGVSMEQRGYFVDVIIHVRLFSNKWPDFEPAGSSVHADSLELAGSGDERAFTCVDVTGFKKLNDSQIKLDLAIA